MDKEKKAIDRIKLASTLSLQKYGAPLICTYSGGKDSDVLLELFKRSGVPFEVHNSHTTVDAPETVYHIREVFKDLEEKGYRAVINKPKYKGGRVSMWTLIPIKKYPPTRVQRYCCQVLKEQSGRGRMITTGVRWAESIKRRNRAEYEVIGRTVKDAVRISDEVMLNNDNDDRRKFIESCTLKAKTVCNPIIDWTDREVWDFYYGECKKHNPLYERGYTRVGCIGCPMATRKQRLKEFYEYPTYEKAYKRAFKKMLEARDRSDKWENEEDVFRWWLDDPTIKGQVTINDLLGELKND